MRPIVPLLLVPALLASALAGCVTSAAVGHPPPVPPPAPTQYYRQEEWKVPSLQVEPERWENPYPRAKAFVSATLGAGRVTVEVKDARDKAVVVLEFEGPATVQRWVDSAAGTPGTWAVSVTKAAAGGQLTLQLYSAS